MFTYLRYPDWTARWSEFIKDSLDLMFDLKLDWVAINCAQFSGSGVEAITGHNPYEEDGWLDKITTAVSAAKEIRKRGFDTLDDVIASFYPEIPLSMAWPGDSVLISTTDWDEETRLIMPHGIALADPPYYYAVTPEGLGKGDLYVDGVRAFAVGRKM